MDDNINNFDDDFIFNHSFDDDIFLDELLNSPIVNFPNDNVNLNGICNEDTSYCPSLDDPLEAPESFGVEVGKFMDCLEEQTPQSLIIDEPKQVEQIMSMKIDTYDIRGNDDQLYNEYNTNSSIHISNVPVPLLSHPQQNLTQPIYDGEARFQPPMSSTTVIGYPNMDAGIGGLYQEGMSLSTCNGLQGQSIFPGEIMSMPISTSMMMSMPMSTPMSTPMSMSMLMPMSMSRQMPISMPMPTPILMPRSMPTLMPLREMDYQDMSMWQNSLHDSFQQHGYDSINVQMLGNKQQQQQREQQLHNNSLVVGCNSTTALASNISTIDESTFKIGHISPEEKKEKIKRFMEKRKHRNFKKKIKYTCRKILADNRSRIRGRFVKNDDLGKMATTSTSNYDYKDDEVAIKDGDLYDFVKSSRSD